MNKQESTKDGLLRLFEQSIENSITDAHSKGCFVVNTTTELIPGDQKVCDALSNNQQAFENIFYNFLQRGVERGELSPKKDLKSIASMLFVLNNGLQVVAKIQPNKEALIATVETSLSILD